jgi:hypothetical protein
MKRHFLLAAPLFLAACGGGNVGLDLTSDDASDNALTAQAAADLNTIKSITLTVDEVWVHTSGKDAKDDVKGEDVGDTAGGWQRVSEEDQAFDLMALRTGTTAALAELDLPEGKITQIRLKLKGGEEAGDRVRLVGAVTDSSGNKCDLSVPKSAINPGVKISGVFKAMKIEGSEKYRATVNLKIKDTTKDGAAGCVYKLNPVLKIKKYEVDKK